MRIFQRWFWERYWLLFVVLVILISVISAFSVKTILLSLLLTWGWSRIKTILRKHKKNVYRTIPQRRKFIRRFRRSGSQKRFKGINPDYLPTRIETQAHKDFHRRLSQWKMNHPGKEPNKNQMYRLAINSSHDTLRTRGAKGHWGRQKIRKKILEGKNVVKKYEMK
ncbi:hypothetical protein COV19_02655 [Candidatus Woesearchaeota archaeon CG10_big_fil_rev_8_21_14_0_10_44_13]|nr:MAG: hypothetical protein COV19_02655 [Candidatus Woesearchaeota archaeon CG10_big_fil_rev_8_21_14_0_10_44_13]